MPLPLWILIPIDALAGRQKRRAGLRTIPLKTQCNNHPIPLQQNSSQPSVLLHGMQGVSGSNPLGSISKPRLSLGFLMFGR